MQKIIVITGASSGIGLETKKILEKDNIVISLDRTPTDDPNHITCDISKHENIENAFSIIKEKYGHIDVVINNAGYGLSGAIELIPMEDIKKLFDVNFFGALDIVKQSLPLMSSGGKIINISSACAIFALPYRSMYCASKSALSMLSIALNMECKPSKISVCTVCPGDTKTNFTKNRIKINTTNERYGESVIKSANFVDKREDRRMSPIFVAKKLVKLVNKKKMPTQIIIGTKYKFFYFFKRILPTNLFYKIVNKLFNKK